MTSEIVPKNLHLRKNGQPVLAQDIVSCGATSGPNPALCLSSNTSNSPVTFTATKVKDDVFKLHIGKYPVQAVTGGPQPYESSYVVLRMTTDGSTSNDQTITDRFRIIPTQKGTYEIFALMPGGTSAQPLHIRTEQHELLCSEEGRGFYKLVGVHPTNRTAMFVRGAFTLSSVSSGSTAIEKLLSGGEETDKIAGMTPTAWGFVGGGVALLLLLILAGVFFRKTGKGAIPLPVHQPNAAITGLTL